MPEGPAQPDPLQDVGPAPGLASPFRLQTAPGEVVAHRAWRAAHDQALALLARDGRAALLGRAGTGKTLLLATLAEALRTEGRRVLFASPAEPPVHPGAAGTVLLVDEADGLPDAVLAGLYAWPGPVLLAALPGFAARLDEVPGPVARIALDPLTPEAVARVVALRLDAAGQRRDAFAPDAVLALARLSAGLMRPVVVLASAAWFLARLEGEAARVEARHVEEAAAMSGLAAGGEADGPPADPDAPEAMPATDAAPWPPDAAPMRADADRHATAPPAAEAERSSPAIPAPRGDAPPLQGPAVPPRPSDSPTGVAPPDPAPTAGVRAVATKAAPIPPPFIPLAPMVTRERARLATGPAAGRGRAAGALLAAGCLGFGLAWLTAGRVPQPAVPIAWEAASPARDAFPGDGGAGLPAAEAEGPGARAAAPGAAMPPAPRVAAEAPDLPLPPPAPLEPAAPASRPTRAEPADRFGYLGPPPPRPHAAPPARSAPLPADLPAPPPPGAAEAGILMFRGLVQNETLNRGGHLALSIRPRGGGGAVVIGFHASAGLLGTGELSGTLSPDGRIAASGRLMVGRNPFDCSLTARITGGQIAGSAIFLRPGQSEPSRSNFVLTQVPERS